MSVQGQRTFGTPPRVARTQAWVAGLAAAVVTSALAAAPEAVAWARPAPGAPQQVPGVERRAQGAPQQARGAEQEAQQGAQQQTQAEAASQQERARAEIDLVINERVMVIGDETRARDLPGSAHFLSTSQLERQAQAFDDVHRLLRQVPGVNLQEEEGYGLRPNIGLRGSGSERSAKITLMEDGVLIAPAPYAAPAAYYFPTAGRMRAIEVRKGSSQIKYGPRTNGGALNLLSSAVPNDFAFRAQLTVGENDTGRGLLRVGDSGRRFGWLLETYQLRTDGYKRLDDGAPTGYELQDYLLKARVNSEPDASVYQDLEVKLGKTKQVSDETYLGLTDADFRANPNRRYAGSQADVFRSDHEQFQARYFVALSSRLDVTAVGYRNEFFRDWYKLQSINSVGISEIFAGGFAPELAIAKGAISDADALKVRANRRSYYSQGVQAVVGFRPPVSPASHQFEFGVRYHEDQEDRFQHEDGFQMRDGEMFLTSRGAPGSQSNRIGDARAWSFFVQDLIEWGRWSFIPGVRFESIELVRTDFAASDPDRLSPSRVRSNDVNVAVPGLGVGYDVSDQLRFFGGVHKGFGPPGPGTDEFTEAEESINYELGARFDRGGLAVELVGFFNDYSNLLGADTLSSGGTGTGNLFNGGSVEVIGLEAGARFDVAEGAGWNLGLPVRLVYTYTDAEFTSSFTSDFGPWGEVVSGDKLPYLATHQLAGGIGVETDGWRVDLEGTYNSPMRTEVSQGPIDPARATDAFLVWNFSGELSVNQNVAVFGAVENLTDHVHVVARRPAGARPGLPRTLLAGLKLDF